jgi:cytochrome c biogenesis protein CcmG/thiol:disulfide interchange protein DsbE
MNLRTQFGIWLIAVAALVGAYWLLVSSAPPRVDVGSTAPDFSAINVATGKTVTLHSGYGRTVTLVNIWGTWCGPCIGEMPAMDSLYRSLSARGFRIAAVSVDEPGLDEVRKFVAVHQISFDVLNDPTGKIKQIYQTTGVPESFLIDRTGHIVRIAQLAAPWNSAENHRIIEHLLAAPAS